LQTNTSAYTRDLEDQSVTNYVYDEIGNLISDGGEAINRIAWTNAQKIDTIYKDKSHSKIWFNYDAMQNRIVKYVQLNDSPQEQRTYYIRDAQGNVMATYTGFATYDAELDRLTWDSLRLSEQHIYGSSRVGMELPNLQLYPSIPENPNMSDTGRYAIFEGWKRYEISNHLGNVLSVITDRKRGAAASGSQIQWFEADVLSAQQYYPFGMLMPGSATDSLRRQYTLGNNDYRYGFNGKEGDDEVKGDDNQQDYGMRIYDPRVGRFLSVDPIAREYPWYTPYQFAGNKPIRFIDRDGAEEDDPDRFYRNSWAAISNNVNNSSLRQTNPEYYERLSKIWWIANGIANDNEFKGQFLGARAMRRYLEGKGGYDIYSYNSMVGEDNFDKSMTNLNRKINDQVFMEVEKRGNGTYDLTIDAEEAYVQGAYESGEDFWWAFGGFSIIAQAKVNVSVQDNQQPKITGSVDYMFRDNYVWPAETGTFDIPRAVMGIPTAPEFRRLRDLGAQFFSVRAYYTSNVSVVQNNLLDRVIGLGPQKLIFSNFSDTNRMLSERMDRYQLLDETSTHLHSYNRSIQGN